MYLLYSKYGKFRKGLNKLVPGFWFKLGENKPQRESSGKYIAEAGRSWLHFLPSWILSKSDHGSVNIYHVRPDIFSNSSTEKQPAAWELAAKQTVPLTHGMFRSLDATQPSASFSALLDSPWRWLGHWWTSPWGHSEWLFRAPFLKLKTLMHTAHCQRWSASKWHLNVIKRILGWIGLILQGYLVTAFSSKKRKKETYW